MDSRTEQPIPVIHINPKGVWDMDLSDIAELSPKAPMTLDDQEILTEIAEAAIRLAERAGADPDDLETLAMLLESVRGK